VGSELYDIEDIEDVDDNYYDDEINVQEELIEGLDEPYYDSNEEHEKTYHYSEIYPLFKFKRVWDKDDRHATVLSNYSDLEDLW
jgi:hypothetical protein